MSASLEAQLSAIAATIEEHSRRVADLAVDQRAEKRDERVRALEEIERNLRAASRRLDRLVRDLQVG
ncbi:MAG: hypothetical protein GEV08_17720 [Acidimicrobiia bacterium]|nr:hypothetical protein [Acidimicrobiia bacterium]